MLLSIKKSLFVSNIVIVCLMGSMFGKDTVVPNSPVIHLAEDQFDAVVLKSQKPVVIDFFATWCGPCKKIKPLFHEIAKIHGEQYCFVEIDIDECQEIAQRYAITSVPTFIIMKNGVEYSRDNRISKENFSANTEELLSKEPKSISSEVSKANNDMALLTAVCTGNVAQVKEFIARNENVNCIVKFPVQVGKYRGKEMDVTPLSMALYSSNKEIATMLLDAGALDTIKLNYADGQQYSVRDLLKKTKEESVALIDEMIEFLDGYAQSDEE